MQANADEAVKTHWTVLLGIIYVDGATFAGWRAKRDEWAVILKLLFLRLRPINTHYVL